LYLSHQGLWWSSKWVTICYVIQKEWACSRCHHELWLVKQLTTFCKHE
jgi:hypothetical protein